MQTSKLILVISAFTLLTGVSNLGANETEAQKKAREALRQKMQELEGQPQPAAPSAPAASQPPAPVPPPAVAPVAPPPTTPVTPSPATPIAAPQSPDSDAQARARQALRQKMNEGQVQQPAAPGDFAATSAPAATWNPNAGDSAAQAKAREALWQKMRERDAQQPVAPPIAASGEPSFQPGAVFKPIDSVPSAVSGAKAGKLAELLRQYRADQITPEEYHKQRAAILADK